MSLNDVTVRHLEDDDMVEVSGWFSERKWRVPPQKEMLPETAYVAEWDGKLLSVIWLYVTNSGICILDWVATNPKYPIRGIRSLKKVTEFAEEVAMKVDKRAFIHFTHNDKLAKHLNKKCGFKNDGKVNISIKLLGGV